MSDWISGISIGLFIGLVYDMFAHKSYKKKSVEPDKAKKNTGFYIAAFALALVVIIFLLKNPQ